MNAPQSTESTVFTMNVRAFTNYLYIGFCNDFSVFYLFVSEVNIFTKKLVKITRCCKILLFP